MRFILSLIAVVGVLVAGLCLLAVRAWEASGGPVMSVHGYIALGLGALFTFGLAAGLMALVFYSSRHGYDDEAGAPDEIDERIP
ncbi:MAG: hypothetical protein P1U88_21515 [Thalassobaculaceae bacterium]|nr:hypothetical protein [Thalassobaculaceae bacterium]